MLLDRKKNKETRNFSRVPFFVSRKTSYTLLAIFLFLDIFFVAVYLLSKLPQTRELTTLHQMASLDLNKEANLPTNYSILKLYFGSLVSFFMIFWYDKQKNVPTFWYVSVVGLFLMGLDESAQLHELWAASIAVKLFGDTLSGNQYTILPYALMLGVFYISSLNIFFRRSIISLVFFFFSGLLMVLSQAVEWQFHPAMNVMYESLGIFGNVTGHINMRTLILAWEEGLEQIGFTLLVAGILWGVCNIQKGSEDL